MREAIKQNKNNNSCGWFVVTSPMAVITLLMIRVWEECHTTAWEEHQLNQNTSTFYREQRMSMKTHLPAQTWTFPEQPNASETDLFVLLSLLPPPPALQGVSLRPMVHQCVQRLPQHQVPVVKSPHACVRTQRRDLRTRCVSRASNQTGCENK